MMRRMRELGQELGFELPDFLKEEKDFTTWKQAGKLTPDEMLQRRRHEIDSEAIVREERILRKQLDMLKGKVELAGQQWWASLYTSHSLPDKGSYHITIDGRILVDPESLIEKDGL